MWLLHDVRLEVDAHAQVHEDVRAHRLGDMRVQRNECIRAVCRQVSLHGNLSRNVGEPLGVASVANHFQGASAVVADRGIYSTKTSFADHFVEHNAVLTVMVIAKVQRPFRAAGCLEVRQQRAVQGRLRELAKGRAHALLGRRAV